MPAACSRFRYASCSPAERLNKLNLNAAETSQNPTSLAVDYSRASGADLLVAMVGPLVGYQVEYWMDINRAKPATYRAWTAMPPRPPK